jgi:3-oxoacyl-[acyl-carrier protein] reductase
MEDNFNKWQIGDRTELKKRLLEKDVVAFSNLTGDNNPLHMNEQYAAKTRFGHRVVHGMLSASYISTVIGTQIPGEGSLWMSQTINFIAPARIGDEITIIATVTSKSEALRIIGLDISITNQDGSKLITGSSKVKVIEPLKKKMKNLKTIKKAALITGSSRGIGAAIARKLAKDGFPVVINYSNSSDEAKELQTIIIKEGGSAILCCADVSNFEQVQSMVLEAADTFGGIEVLVNNASGAIWNKPFSELEWKDIQKHLDIQLQGAFNTCKSVLPFLEEQKYGKVINITSIYTDSTPPVNTYDYILAKSALSSFTKSLAAEYGVKGICINNVSPGMTETTLIRNIPEKTKLVTQMQAPLRRLASTEDIANVVSFLSSSAGDYITGETIRVCGGQRMV